MRKIFTTTGIGLCLTTLLAGCAYDHYGDRYGYADRHADRAGYYDRDYRYGNGYAGRGEYGPPHASPFRGPGAARLDPWLAATAEGHKFVADHYDLGAGNYLSAEDAVRANIFFRRWSDTDRDYRLTDAEIRTSLVHVRNGYGIGAY